MFKKICLMMFVCMFILSNSMSVHADETVPEGCIPYHEMRRTAVLYTEWEKINFMQCEFRTYYLDICDNCGAIQKHYEPGEISDHNMILEEHRHLTGQNLHEYIYACTKCFYTESTRLGCPGDELGSCIIIMSYELPCEEM